MALDTLLKISQLGQSDFDCDAAGNLKLGWTLVDNADGTISLVDNASNVISTVPKADVTDNGDGTFTFTNGDGTDVTFDTNSILTQIPDNEDSDVTNGDAHTIATHTSAGGTVTNINETVTSITDNGDGTLTFVDEAGNSTLVSILSVDMDITDVVDPATDSTITFVGENGQPNVTVDICSKVAFCDVSALQNVSASTDAPVDCAIMMYDTTTSLWEAVDVSGKADCALLGTH